MKTTVFEARRLAKEARAAVQAAQGAAALVKENPDQTAWGYVDFAYWWCRSAQQDAEEIADWLDPDEAEDDPAVLQAHFRVTQDAQAACAAADDLISIAENYNHVIRR